MDKGERIRLIQRVRDALSELPGEDEDLLFEVFGLGARPTDSWDVTLTAWLNARADDTQLESIAQHLEVLDNSGPVSLSSATTVANSDRLYLFGSHLSSHRVLLGQVEAELAQFNVRLFVAHDSIPMDALWEREIVDALNQCHAGVAFIHPGIHDSYYCMQELGWILGRGIPVARLMFGEAPRGLLGAHQGRPLEGRSAGEIAKAIMDWAVTNDTLHLNMAESLTTALDASTSYNKTDIIWGRLTQMSGLNVRQLRRVLHAVETNSQVFGANVGGWRGVAYRREVADRVEQWDTTGAVAERISVLRTTPWTEYIVSPDDVAD